MFVDRIRFDLIILSASFFHSLSLSLSFQSFQSIPSLKITTLTFQIGSPLLRTELNRGAAPHRFVCRQQIGQSSLFLSILSFASRFSKNSIRIDWLLCSAQLSDVSIRSLVSWMVGWYWPNTYCSYSFRRIYFKISLQRPVPSG